MKRVLLLATSILLFATMYATANGKQESTGTTSQGNASSGQATASPTKYHEAPMLAAEVKAGKLPPVDQRLPDDPVVVKPNDRIGQYGGILVRGNGPLAEANLILNRPATDSNPDIIKS